MPAVVPGVAFLFALAQLPPALPTPAMDRSTPAVPAKAPSQLVMPSVAAVRATPKPADAPLITSVKHEVVVPDETRTLLRSATSKTPAHPVVVPDEARTNLTATAGNTPAAAAKPGAVPPATPAAEKPPVPPVGAAEFTRVVREGVAAGTFTGDRAATLVIDAAVMQAAEGRLDAALAEADYAVSHWPDSPAARLGRARVRYEAGDYAGAAADSGRVLELDPEDDGTRYAHAMTLTQAGRHAAAHAELSRLIRRHPSRAEYYRERAVASVALNEWADADLDTEIAVELAPTDPRVRLLRSQVCRAFGRAAEGFQHLKVGYDSRAAGPATDTRALVEIVDAMIPLARSEMTAASATEFTTWMTRAQPGYAPGHARLAEEMYRAGEYGLAAASATTAIDRDARSAHAYVVRGLAREKLADPAALADFEAAHRLSPESAQTWTELVPRLRAAGEFREALALAQAGVARHPDAAKLRVELAVSELLAGHVRAAERNATYATWLAVSTTDAARAQLVRAAARLVRGDGAASLADLAAAGRRMQFPID